MTEPDEAEVLAWLGARSDRVIETACAHVFLTANAAYKLKRHVNLGYVDFSTPERRRWALQRELEFNRVAAPDIYRAVRRITRQADGGLALDGPGETVEHLLEMRRFDDGAVLAANPAAINGEMADALGRAIEGFHAQAPLKPEGGWSALDFSVASNAKLLRGLAPRLGSERVETLVALTAAALERHAPLLKARSAQGFARRCHGDLHLGNILVEKDRPVLFDCIEFDDLLSDIDVLYDLAFLLMDLNFRDRRDAAVRVLSAYLDEAARDFPVELWAGMAALPLMMSVRAGVRAHVCANSHDDSQARAYIQAAIAHLSPPPAVLAAIGGLSGVGKSTFARAIAPALGPAPGAVVLRSDEVRKRLAGAGRLERLSREAYTAEFNARVYETMLEDGRSLLKAGHGVVLDATFTDPRMRRVAEQLATEVGASFHGAWLEAPPDILLARVAGRTGDASDATVDVLREQLERHGGDVVDWPKVDATASTEAAAKAWLA